MYIENSMDIYGDRREKLDGGKRCQMFHEEIYNKISEKKLIRPTDPTVHRACEGKQLFFFFAF